MALARLLMGRVTLTVLTLATLTTLSTLTTLHGAHATCVSSFPYFEPTPAGCSHCAVRTSSCTSSCFAYDRDSPGGSLRTEGKLLGLYPFTEGSGTTVSDTSGVGSTADAAVFGLGAGLEWVSPNGMRQTGASGTRVVSVSDISKYADAIATTGEFALEVWAVSADAAQSGPARVATLSAGATCSTEQFLQMGQDGTGGSYRLNVSPNDQCSSVVSSIWSAGVDTHLVYQYDAATGDRIVWKNGVEVFHPDEVGGTPTALLSSFELHFFNEQPPDDRTWRGTIYMAAIYDGPLSSDTIIEHYSNGTDIASNTMLTSCGLCGVHVCCPPLAEAEAAGALVSCPVLPVQAGSVCTLSCPTPGQVPVPYTARERTCSGPAFAPSTWSTHCAYPPVAADASSSSAVAASLTDASQLGAIVFTLRDELASPVTSSGSFALVVDSVSPPGGALASPPTCTLLTSASCSISTVQFTAMGVYTLNLTYSESGDFTGAPSLASMTLPQLVVQVRPTWAASPTVADEHTTLTLTLNGVGSFGGVSVNASRSTCAAIAAATPSITVTGSDAVFVYSGGFDFESTGPYPCVMAFDSGVPGLDIPDVAVIINDVNEPALLSVLPSPFGPFQLAANISVSMQVTDVDAGAAPELALATFPRNIRVFDVAAGAPTLVRSPPIAFAPGPNPLIGSLLLAPVPGTYTTNMTIAYDTGPFAASQTLVFGIDIPCPDLVNMIVTASGVCQCAEFGQFINVENLCEVCPSRTYYDAAQGAFPCVDCVLGMYCPGGAVPPTSDNGFFEFPPGVYVPCSPPNVCRRGNICSPGNTGIQCLDCEPGYYSEGGVCKKCPNLGPLLIIILALLMVAIMVLLVKIARKSAAYFTALSVGFNFLQIVSLMASFKLKWPSFLLRFFDMLSLVNFNVSLFRPECAAGGAVDYFKVWLFKLVIPFIFAALFGLAIVVLAVYGWFYTRGLAAHAAWTRSAPRITRIQQVLFRNASANAFITILVLLYLSLVATSFEAFECDDNNKLIKDPRVKCGSDSWQSSYFPVAIVALALYGVGIPLTFFLALYMSRLSLFRELTIVRFGLLFRRYRPQMPLPFWELVILLRKLCIVLALFLFPDTPVAQALVALAAISLSAAAHIWAQPYLTRRVNRLESLHLVCADVVLLCGLSLLAASESDSDSLITTIGVIVIVIVCVNIVIVGSVVSQEIRYQYKRVRHGVQGGFASDEIALSESFFSLGVYVREHSRNMMGTVSTLILESRRYTELTAELCNHDGTYISEHNDLGYVSSQSDGFTHVFVTQFNVPGRYQLKIFAAPEGEHDDPAGPGKYATLLALQDRDSDDMPSDDDDNDSTAAPAASPSEGGVVSYLRGFFGEVCSAHDTGEGNCMMSFSMNCDALPPSKVNFLDPLDPLVERGGVVLHPHFTEVSRSTPTFFAVKIPGACDALLSRDQPNDLTDGIPLAPHGSVTSIPGATTKSVRNMDFPGSQFIFTTTATVTVPGPLTVWARVTSVSHAPDTGVIVSQVSSFFPCVTFEVLQGRAGWDDMDEDVDDAMLDTMLTGSSAGVPLNVLAPGVAPAIVHDSFKVHRGVLYEPLELEIPVGPKAAPVTFRIRLPGATSVVVSPSPPSHPNDGIVLFKTADGSFTSEWDPSDGLVAPGAPLYVWAQLTDSSGVAAPVATLANPATTAAPTAPTTNDTDDAAAFVSILDDVAMDFDDASASDPTTPGPDGLMTGFDMAALDAQLGLDTLVSPPPHSAVPMAASLGDDAFLTELMTKPVEHTPHAREWDIGATTDTTAAADADPTATAAADATATATATAAEDADSTAITTLSPFSFLSSKPIIKPFEIVLEFQASAPP